MRVTSDAWDLSHPQGSDEDADPWEETAVRVSDFQRLVSEP